MVNLVTIQLITLKTGNQYKLSVICTAYLQDGQTEKNGFDNQKIQAFNKTLGKCWLISQVLKFFSACDDIAQSVKVKTPPVELVSSSNFLCFMEAVFE